MTSAARVRCHRERVRSARILELDLDVVMIEEMLVRAQFLAAAEQDPRAIDAALAKCASGARHP